ncbi:LOW QUALITY PROTEIN: hypothetical protein PHMEG_00037583 [Phytophthora megakarya]|uniref:Uncharacterized protein n=1 Tax=Phytophthora megakarya TaxID=4795 RepID=A0A225UJ92_9STRA|nr:LOW QUALITY PROTEIN: hypothetical protein PHMEG_00037583 [Phytophthora megakarya]
MLHYMKIAGCHLLVQSFELYQIKAGPTCHPLELALEPPPHLHDWVHQTVRAVARLQQRLLLYNVKSTSKIRIVGDITDAGETKMARKEHLSHKGRWPLWQQREYESLEGDLKIECCRDGTQTLLKPMGRTVLNVAHLDMAVVEIPPQGFFIVSQYIVQNGMLALRGYELEQRIGDSTTYNEIGFGLEIDVQRHPGTDVWSIRPDGRDTDYAEVCVPIEVTQIRSGQRGDMRLQQVIIWNATTVRGTTGSMDRSIIQIACDRSNHRYQEVLRTGTVVAVDRSCAECKRLRGSERCGVCGAGITNTAGAVINPHQQTCVGHGRPVKLWMLPAEISPQATGLAVYLTLPGHGGLGPTGFDNWGGCWIIGRTLHRHDTARDTVTGKRLPHIKYSNRHLIEIRSMIALMRREGSFTAV